MGWGMGDEYAEMHQENMRLKAEVRRLRARLGEPVEDLAICPSCGGRPVLSDALNGTELRHIYCTQCGMSGPANKNIDVVAEKWNALKR